MGWSLEAALVVPISTALLIAGVVLAEPLYEAGVKRSQLEVAALISSIRQNDIYQASSYLIDDAACIGLAVSPGRVIQLARVIRDDLNLLWRLLPDEK